jgi:phosphotriesterase-related protein
MEGVMRTVLLLPAALCLYGWASSVSAQSRSGQPTDLTGKVLTVNGPVDSDQLGQTITHEHIFIDFSLPEDEPERWKRAGRRYLTTASDVHLWRRPVSMDILWLLLGPRWAGNRDNLLLTDEETAIAEVMEFKKAGGRTIVDVTNIGLKRDPGGLRRVSIATGLNIIMGSGWYRDAWHPADMGARSIESLADEIVRDIMVGVGDSRIRAGIIGEVAAEESPGHPLSENEIKAIRAAAQASARTGAPLSLHTFWAPGQNPWVLDVLAEEGADLRRVIVGHAHHLATDFASMKRILDRGVYIQFDLLGEYGTVGSASDDRAVARAIVKLIEAGYNDRILLSQDVCTKVQLKKYGGNGYSFVLEQFIPHLKTLGVTDAQVELMMVANPRRALSFVAPRAVAGH